MRRQLLLACLGAAWLSEVAAFGTDVSATISVSYFKCVEPVADPACVAIDEPSKPTSCPDCRRWEKETLRGPLSVSVAPSYERPNGLLNAISLQAYGEGLPKGQDGTPVSSAYFYENFEKFGWIEVPADQGKSGALVLLPNTGGFVLRESDQGEIMVLYASSARSGDLHETKLEWIAGADTEPRFIVPREILEAGAAEGSPPPRD